MSRGDVGATGEKPTQTARGIKIAIIFLWRLFISSAILLTIPQVLCTYPAEICCIRMFDDINMNRESGMLRRYQALCAVTLAGRGSVPLIAKAHLLLREVA